MCDVSVVCGCGVWGVGCGTVVSHILEDLYNLARSSGPPVVGIDVNPFIPRLTLR